MMVENVHESPLGHLRLIAEAGALVGLLFPDHGKAFPAFAAARPGTDPALDQARRELDAYFTGRLRRFQTPLAPRGTPFQQSVWRALQDISWGQTLTYAALAARAGGHARPTAGAVGRNPISILIPCHRVIGASGALTGYAGGLERKAALLTLEKGAPNSKDRLQPVAQTA